MLADRINAANAEALRRIGAASPVLTEVRRAGDVIPILTEKALLHAGPPVAPDALCGPMRGAVLGAARYEGWARTSDEAAALLDRGAIALECTHDWHAVGPMAGVVSASMPVLEVRDRANGIVAYCPVNEGVGAVLRFGAYGESVLERLRWLERVFAPALDAALQRMDGLPLIPLMARALTMGDEMHQRNVAATSLFCRTVAPALAEAAPEHLPAILRFLGDNDQFFLNPAMAACKATMDAVREIPYSTLVSTMSRNGVEFGLRVAGLGDQWFVAPAPQPDGLYFPGYTAADANPDMGDSAIIETSGLGGMAMAAAPAVAGFLGLPSVEEAASITRTMKDITLQATGIDLRRIVRLETAPVINTGIAHRRAGVGQIGAGTVRAPLAAFQAALEVFVERYAAAGDAGR
jgi:hypothetical protein